MHIRTGRRTTNWLTRRPSGAGRRLSILERLDMALVDPPSLCCDDDRLCAACLADSMPALGAHG